MPNSSQPPARDRAATENRILAAVGEVLARDGFHAVGVNAIARQARVDKVLIYRYFGGLPRLLQAWGASGRFWPAVDELIGNDRAAVLALPAAERLALFLERFVDALRARPLTVEILAAEVAKRHELSAILDAEREQWGQQVEAVLGGDEWGRDPYGQGIAVVLVAGVQYLLLRARTTRVFGGFDLRSDEAWASIKSSLRAAATKLLGDVHAQPTTGDAHSPIGTSQHSRQRPG